MVSPAEKPFLQQSWCYLTGVLVPGNMVLVQKVPLCERAWDRCVGMAMVSGWQRAASCNMLHFFRCFYCAESSQLLYTLRTESRLCKEFRQFFTVKNPQIRLPSSRLKHQLPGWTFFAKYSPCMCVSGLHNSFSDNGTSSARISYIKSIIVTSIFSFY